MKGGAKLQGGRGGHLGRIGVDLRESVIHNSTRAPLALGGNTERRDAEVGEVLDKSIWEDDPVAFLNHIAHLVFQKMEVEAGGGVGATTDGRVALGHGPGWSCKMDGGPY
jgi:hypothetical protein